MSSIDPTIAQLLTELEASRQRVSNLLLSTSPIQDWQPAPEEWSFRFIAGHMAQVEQDAVLARAQAIAANQSPHYSYYYNTGWDFSGHTIREWLDLWQSRRAQLTQLVQNLAAEQFTYTGTHDYFGKLTIQRVLEIAIEHDGEHEAQLRELIPQAREG